MDYRNGHGVPQDYAKAVRWLRKAAGQGVAKAQSGLGVMYSNGQGVPQEYAKAMQWTRKAPERGVALAQHNLGVTYYGGQGVPQDYAQAHMWFTLAASRLPPARTAIMRSRNATSLPRG